MMTSFGHNFKLSQYHYEEHSYTLPLIFHLIAMVGRFVRIKWTTISTPVHSVKLC